jgi:hypothetical protein
VSSIALSSAFFNLKNENVKLLLILNNRNKHMRISIIVVIVKKINNSGALELITVNLEYP